MVGETADLTYSTHHMGPMRAEAGEGRDATTMKATLDRATLIIVGQDALRGSDGAAVLGQRCG